VLSHLINGHRKMHHLDLGSCSILMNGQEAQTLQLEEIVVWTPDGMKGEVIAKDSFGAKICWEDGQLGYYQFTDLLSQVEVIVSGVTKPRDPLLNRAAAYLQHRRRRHSSTWCPSFPPRIRCGVSVRSVGGHVR
jgi:hypothetical protein